MIGGGHGGAVVSPVDRASEFTPVQRVDGKRAEVVGKTMTDLPEGPGARVHTITVYDGGEFAGHAKVAKALEADFLLPTPHHSWERGLNGHTDGPPRRHLPKGTCRRVRPVSVGPPPLAPETGRCCASDWHRGDNSDKSIGLEYDKLLPDGNVCPIFVSC